MKRNSINRAYTEKLQQIIDDIFDSWPGTTHELAAEAFLHENTVYRLKSFQTELPRLQTIFKLAKAVGIELRLIKLRQARKAG